MIKILEAANPANKEINDKIIKAFFADSPGEARKILKGTGIEVERREDKTRSVKLIFNKKSLSLIFKAEQKTGYGNSTPFSEVRDYLLFNYTIEEILNYFKLIVSGNVINGNKFGRIESLSKNYDTKVIKDSEGNIYKADASSEIFTAPNGKQFKKIPGLYMPIIIADQGPNPKGNNLLDFDYWGYLSSTEQFPPVKPLSQNQLNWDERRAIPDAPNRRDFENDEDYRLAYRKYEQAKEKALRPAYTAREYPRLMNYKRFTKEFKKAEKDVEQKMLDVFNDKIEILRNYLSKIEKYLNGKIEDRFLKNIKKLYISKMKEDPNFLNEPDYSILSSESMQERIESQDLLGDIGYPYIIIKSVNSRVVHILVDFTQHLHQPYFGYISVLIHPYGSSVDFDFFGKERVVGHMQKISNFIAAGLRKNSEDYIEIAREDAVVLGKFIANAVNSLKQEEN